MWWFGWWKAVAADYEYYAMLIGDVPDMLFVFKESWRERADSYYEVPVKVFLLLGLVFLIGKIEAFYC